MKKPDRILLLKMDHIGDALWSFPAIRALRAAFPAAVIDMLCTPYLAGAFRRVPELTQVIEYDATAAMEERQAVWRQMRDRTYNTAIVLGPVDKVNHLAFLSRAKERLGYAYSGNLFRSVIRILFLTRRFDHPADIAAKSGLPLPHEVTAMLELVGKYGAAVPSHPTLFFPLTTDEKQAAAATLQKLLPGKESFAALHLCAKSFSHGWNESTFAQLARVLQQVLPDTGWIVTAGPAEEPFLESYRPILTAAGMPVVSGMALPSMAAILARMQVLVSWDTGVVHLASAVGTPVVDIFPAKDFDYCVQRWGPWGPGGYPVHQKTEVLDANTLEAIVRAVREIVTPTQEELLP